MGWGEALAGLAGGLKGGIEAYRWQKEEAVEAEDRRLKQEAARRAEQRAAEDQAMQRQTHQRTLQTYAQQDADRVLEDLPEGSSVSDLGTLSTLGAGGRMGRLDVGQTDFGNLMGGMMTGTVQPSAATVTARTNKDIDAKREQGIKDAEFARVRSTFEADPRLAPFLPILDAKRGGVTLGADDLRTPEERGQRKLAEETPVINARAAATRGNQSHAAALSLSNAQSMAATNHELATARAIARAVMGEDASERAFQRKQDAAKDDGADPFGTDAEDDEDGMPAPSWFGTTPPAFNPTASPQAAPAAPAPAPTTPQTAKPPTTRTPAPAKMTPQEQNLRGQMDRQLQMVKQAQASGQDVSGLLLRLRALRDQLSAQGRP